MRLAVFHYHLLPGGVTQVVTSSAIAALKYLPDIDEITLVSGGGNNTENVTDIIKEKLGSDFSGKSVIKCMTLPKLGYISDMDKYPDPENIKKTLYNHFAGDLWWIHNYHLGKNPFFTEAILQIAEENPEQKIVLQIHDFPEESRYKNLETLLKYVTRPLYPISPNIKYVTINSRDRNYLITAGIPEKMVFLLNNPVEPLEREKGDGSFDTFLQAKTLSNRRKEETGRKIGKVLSKSSTSFIKGAPLMIYPVRTIRRKNVLEAGLLAKCSVVPVNLLPTLPGVSKSEIGYSKIVDSCFKDKLIPGAAQAGIVLADNGITFSDIMNAGKIIISSSVQEGFGYLFVNSLQWGKPLFARKLDIISDFSDIFSAEFSHFYDKVEIPLNTTMGKQLKMEYNRKIYEISKFLDEDIVSNLKKQKTQVIQESSIDFSYLSPAMQKKFLKDLEDPGLLNETRKMNNIKLKQLETMLSIDVIAFDETAIEKFSLSNHAEQIGNIIFSLKNNIQETFPPKKNIDYSIITSFANFASTSLLYDPV